MSGLTGVGLLASDASKEEIKARGMKAILIKKPHAVPAKAVQNLHHFYCRKHVTRGSKIHALGQEVPSVKNNNLLEPKSYPKASPPQT